MNKRRDYQGDKYGKQAGRSVWAHIAVHALITGGILLYALVIGCPLRRFAGVCCPGCGLTRAWLSFFRLDLASALYYHPLFLFFPPLLFFRIHKRAFRLPGSERLWNILLCTGCAAMLLVYFYRLVSGSPVVYADIESGLLYRLITGRLFTSTAA